MAKAQRNFNEEFAPMWERLTKYTIEVAEAMPDSLYSYTASPEVMNFREQLLHIRNNLYTLNGHYVKEEKTERIDRSAAMPKSEVIAELKQAFAYVAATLPNMNEEELGKQVDFFTGDQYPKERMLYLMKDHTTHHRAQLILYLRMNGIAPPRYVGW